MIYVYEGAGLVSVEANGYIWFVTVVVEVLAVITILRETH